MQNTANQHKIICVVEDNHELREGLGLIVSMTNDFILGGLFANAEEAIQKAPLVKPDAVLMDISLPGSSGIECTMYLKNVMPHLQILMCTSYEDNDKIFSSLKAGASGYILKTEGPIKILEALKDMLNGGSPMSASIARKVVASFNTINTSTTKVLQVLTDREKQLLECLSTGMMNKEVAANMQISIATVRTHIQNIYEKLHVNTRVEAVNLFLKR
ncbi:MAG: response regulator transcription factor [Ferruginibacter sp.]|nr:response regulator transcription factor [Ferruginibacter sp.]